MLIAGVDEAGRGPLAGPVVAAAVIFGDRRPCGIDDSKKLTAARREALAVEIREAAVAFHVAIVDAPKIDEINILNATMLAMREAVAGLGMIPGHVLIDGNRAPELDDIVPQSSVHAMVNGDALEPVIGAASILAKTCRDRLMVEYDRRWPEYGFARHKGYPTAAHMAALRDVGPCPLHRRSFRPVRECEETRS